MFTNMFKKTAQRDTEAIKPDGNTTSQAIKIRIERGDEPSNLRELLKSKGGIEQISKNLELTATLIKEAEEKVQMEQKERDEKIHQTIEKSLDDSHVFSCCGMVLFCSLLALFMCAIVRTDDYSSESKESVVRDHIIKYSVNAISATLGILACSTMFYILWKRIELRILKNKPTPQIDQTIATLKKFSEEKKATVNETTSTVTEESRKNQEEKEVNQPLLDSSPSFGYGSCGR